MATRADVERVQEHLHRASDVAFFFDQLTSPEWIDPLRELGFFAAPPEPEMDRDHVRYPVWAASRYLARVAADAPDKVFAVVNNLPESDNPRVHEDVTEAASSLPAALAARLAPRVAEWIENDRHLLLLPERALDVALVLAAGDEAEAALTLARALFAAEATADGLVGSRVRSRVSEHDYEPFLRQLVGPLTTAAGIEAVRLLVGLLSDILGASRSSAAGAYEDASTIWRRDIAERSRGGGRFEPILNALVDAICDAARALPADAVDDAFTDLIAASGVVFRRIALQIVADGVVPSVDTLRELAVDRKALSSHSLELEYLRALPVAARSLTSADLDTLVGWIQSGPLDGARLSNRLGDDWQPYLRLWQGRRLHALGDAVPPDSMPWARQLADGLGPDDLLPNRPAPVAGFVGSSTPRTSSELARSSIDDVVSYLDTWEPSSEWDAPSREGLGQSLAEAVAQRPLHFSTGASRFAGLEPIYIRSLLSGLREALKASRRISWVPVVGLCEWVLARDVALPEHRSTTDDHDPGWSWTVMEIGRFVEAALSAERGHLPKRLATRVRRLLLAITATPDPETDEMLTDASGMSPAERSLNTTRGVAAHALIRFAAWERTALKRKHIHPETRSAIERIASPVTEPSLTVHSVVGWWFGTLTWLDPTWAASLADHVFPKNERDDPYWWAAWSAFILFGHTSRAVHGILAPDYQRAAGLVGEHEAARFFRHGRKHSAALADHVLAFVAWGIETEPDQGVLGAVLAGPTDTRAQLVELAGRLVREHETLDRAVVDRLVRYWDGRRRAAETALDVGLRAELSRFSWWCGGPTLNTAWWLDNLIWILRSGVRLEAAFLVLEAMPRAAHVDPVAAVAIIDDLSRMDQERWIIQGHRDAVGTALAAAIASGGAASRSARVLIHDLGAREVADFRELLPADDSDW